jgi:hypothetical protein
VLTAASARAPKPAAVLFLIREQALERKGLVNREVQSTFPLQVEYSLTPTAKYWRPSRST